MNPGKALILAGLALIVLGSVWMLASRLGLGRLPGDIFIRRERFTLYVPLATCLLLSVILSLVLWLLGRWGR